MKIQSYKWGIAGIIVLAATCTLLAFTGGPRGADSAANDFQDTIPAKDKLNKEPRKAGDRDFDRELRALEKADRQLSEKDWEKMQKDFDGAMDKIDFEKIQADIDNAMKSVDFEKIQKELAQSWSKVDFEKMNHHWEDAMKKIDFEKINREIEESMKKVDWENVHDKWQCAMDKAEWEKLEKDIKKSLEAVSKIDMEKMRADLEKAKSEVEQELRNAEKYNNKNVEESMEKVKEQMEKMKLDMKDKKFDFDFKKIMETASEGIEKARIEVKGFQEMVYAMEAEGLVDTKKDYTIEYDNGEISINGKKQSSAVSDKYKKYFRNDKTSIIKKDGEINIKHGSSNTHID